MDKTFTFSIEMVGSDFETGFDTSYEVVYMLRKLADRLTEEQYSSADPIAELDGIKVYSTSGVPAGKVTVE